MSARIIDNADLYDQGRGYTRRITRFVVAGEDSGTALRRVAADRDRSVAEVRSAVRFAAAVDLIAGNAGRAARRLILAGHRRLPPERVLQISRTHPERQRHAMDQVARGRHPFARPRDGSDPPYDTIDHGEVSSRMARSAGLLVWVADGLAETPAANWPEAAKVQLMSGHVAAVRESCTALEAMLRGWSSDLGSPPRKRPGSRPGQSSGARAPFRPDRALASVAAVGGMAAKNVRDFPRLLRDVPPQAQDLGSVLAGLRRLDLAARELTGVIRAHGRSGAVRRTR